MSTIGRSSTVGSHLNNHLRCWNNHLCCWTRIQPAVRFEHYCATIQVFPPRSRGRKYARNVVGQGAGAYCREDERVRREPGRDRVRVHGHGYQQISCRPPDRVRSSPLSEGWPTRSTPTSAGIRAMVRSLSRLSFECVANPSVDLAVQLFCNPTSAISSLGMNSSRSFCRLYSLSAPNENRGARSRIACGGGIASFWCRTLGSQLPASANEKPD